MTGVKKGRVETVWCVMKAGAENRGMETVFVIAAVDRKEEGAWQWRWNFLRLVIMLRRGEGERARGECGKSGQKEEKRRRGRRKRRERREIRGAQTAGTERVPSGD